MEPEIESIIEQQASEDVFPEYVPDAPGQAGQDNSPLTAEEIQQFGLNPADFPNVALAEDSSSVPSESAEVTDNSPGSGSPSPAPAPQLDANQMFMLQMQQQMQQMQLANQAFQQQLAESLKPKAVPAAPEDPFADLPPEYNTPELKKFAEYMRGKLMSPLESYKQQMESRITEASQAREVQRFETEADQVAQAIISDGFAFQGNEQAIVADGVRDLTLALSMANPGKSPAQFRQGAQNIINTAVTAKLRQMGEQNKQKVQARGYAPQKPVSQGAAPAISPAQFREPTYEEIRAAGYSSAFDAALHDNKGIIELRARRQGRG